MSPPSLKREHSIANTTYSEKSATLTPPKGTWIQKIKSLILTLLSKYWFLLGLAIAIILAWQFPNVAKKGGYLRAEWTIKWGAVIVIFFISGLSLRTKILAQTVLRIRLHLLIQIINLMIIPGVVFGLILLFFKMHMPLNSLLLVGVVIAASTPTTVSSNVVMTKNADGNEASALMNAAIGNVLGIFVSPALVSVFQGPLIDATPEDETPQQAGGKVDFVSVLQQLGLTVLVPLVVGQIIQWLFTEKVAKIKVKCRLSDVSSFCLLTLVWSVFSDAVASGSFGSVAVVDIVAVTIINAGLYISFSLLCWFLAYIPFPFPGPRWIQRLRYSRPDTVAIMYCGATKTVAMGVPLINVLYQHGDPGTIGVLSTPLLLYHVEQLILGNIEVEILKKWVHRGQQDDIEQQQQQEEIAIPAPHDDDPTEYGTEYGSDTTHVPSTLLPSHLGQSTLIQSNIANHSGFMPSPFSPTHHYR
ncbi:SBF-like CPA transporter family-domain-containing protein [Halteromyces radiatus]|uniref:SBF-like CPA transporter family-domain-containing protein n=1 Tax=Halteromyces radiatus TaxID=101107 RepID=UPI00221E5BED|nr:SBF-like CPA transporter family-domain-containing protein [Halteromyces radiatus]KAI8079774.1 SBF-like CPA transporter family-domain-containing protein [Halteromyces radiatus]